ncbi:MAG: hypothetical protein R3344_13950 [Acidobacteriota bacterium]|nr:hypothetical protein [Acidobacteriota bacterium]
MIWLGVVVIVAALAGVIVRGRRRASRLRRARDVAEELLPEIRAVMESADPASSTEGEPASTTHYRAVCEHLPQVLSGEQYFAVETFYHCVESYRDARAVMIEAFAEDDERSLGDRIRAKDRRDRCLKDVYYTGHGAVEKLEEILTSAS